MSNNALFLDRDGVINNDYGYVYKKEDFHFTKDIFRLVKIANNNNFKVIIITNQAGIGRGFYSESDFFILNDWMINKFEEKEAFIDKVYFSPYHPTQGIGAYKKDDFSRKPNPGMLLQAKKELDINFSNSILIGDKISDIEAGLAVGMGKNILLKNKNTKEIYIRNVNSHFKLVDSLKDAIDHFKEFSESVN